MPLGALRCSLSVNINRNFATLKIQLQQQVSNSKPHMKSWIGDAAPLPKKHSKMIKMSKNDQKVNILVYWKKCFLMNIFQF